MKKNLRLFAVPMALLMMAQPLNSAKVHTLGDSTMATYDEDATVTRGWGMYFGQFLTNGWTSINYARGGRDARAGYNELWQTAKSKVEAGDYVLIQFAHNDEKNSGMDGVALKSYYEGIGDETKAAAVDTRGTVPSTTYKECLGQIVDEVKAAGATPVLVAPVCRAYFSGSTIRRNGRHDLGDSFSVLSDDGILTGQSVAADDHTMDYPYHMKALAEEKGVDFIDLTTATQELYESYGSTKCLEYLFDGQGSTHFNTTGALLVARLCAQMMKEQGILADNILLTTDLTASPSTLDFGKAYKGQTVTKELTLNGFSLSPEEGTVTLTAADGVLLSTDKSEWSQTLSIEYNASTLVKTVYAQLTLGDGGAFSSTITMTQGSQTVEVPVTGESVVLEGGTDVLAYWRLEKDDSYELTGPATVMGESWEGMYVQRYANPNAKTVWPDGTGYEATRKMQRNLIVGDTWPADEIDDNPDRYIQFGIKAAEGMTLNVDSISLYLCGAGGNGMCAHVYYSTDDWATRTTIFEGKKMTANNPQFVEAIPVVSLTGDETLQLRIYPWYNGSATGKTLCISDIAIGGVATSNSTGISDAKMAGAECTVYYDTAGVQLSAPQKGVNIVRTSMADGSVKTRKIIY